jgi:hypothetical protein
VAKAGQPHRVPLCDRAIAIVKEMAAPRLNDFVFPSLICGEPLSNMAMLMMQRDMQPPTAAKGRKSTLYGFLGRRCVPCSTLTTTILFGCFRQFGLSNPF